MTADRDFEFKFTSHSGQFSYTILPIIRQSDALKVVSRAFYPLENCCMAIGVANNPKAVNELNELVKEAIKDGVSIVAVDNATNQIVGVSINKIQKLPTPGEISFFDKFAKERCKEKESAALIQLMIDCDSTVNLFEHFNTEKLLEIMFLAVLPEYGQRGLGYELVKVDLQLLAKLDHNFNGPDAATALWTSEFTARIGKRLGFRVLSESFYENLEYDGVKLSDRIDRQHSSIKVSGKKLKD